MDPGALPASDRGIKLLPALGLALALTACAPSYQGPSAPVILMPPPPLSDPNTYPAPQPEPGPYPDVEDKPLPTVIEPIASRPKVAPSAVDSLLASAGEAYRDTSYDTAIAFAERALRIDSRRPEIYLMLGNCYLAKNQSAQARQMALKGIAYSSAESRTRNQLETLLARAGAP